MTVSASTANEAGWNTPLHNPLRVFISAEPWVALAFMFFSFLLGEIWFITLVTLLVVGISLAFTFIGIPILVAALFVWIYAAKFERFRVGVFLRQRIDDPYRTLPTEGHWERFKTRLSDRYVWLDLLYLFLLFPIGIAEFVIAVVAVTVPLSLLMQPVYHGLNIYYDLGWPAATIGNFEIETMSLALLFALIGLPLLILMPYVFIGVGRGHAWFARQILGTDREAQLTERVSELRTQRSQVLDSSLSDLRRIERDLHDGAQQRLVKLSMDLGLAREKLESDPERARALIEEAHEEAKRAMTEIRDLARGILPAVLSDRGLAAAVTALAGRCPVPITVENTVQERLPERVESAAYFIIAEALTNIARHSHATHGSISMTLHDGSLSITVEDNGVGGADAARVTGLSEM
ncbi:MAG: sensor histidine kinase, partial [Chloroflexota bacterium]